MLYIGIDNGVSGALAMMAPDLETTLIPMPTRSELNYQKAGKNITRLDFDAFRGILAVLKAKHGSEIRAVIENPFVNPGNFVATSTSLRCLEAQLIALEELGISRQYLGAKVWQKEFLPDVKGRPALKKASLDIGTRQFPHLALVIKKQKDADAIFIAAYAQRKGL